MTIWVPKQKFRDHLYKSNIDQKLCNCKCVGQNFCVMFRLLIKSFLRQPIIFQFKNHIGGRNGNWGGGETGGDGFPRRMVFAEGTLVLIYLVPCDLLSGYLEQLCKSLRQLSSSHHHGDMAFLPDCGFFRPRPEASCPRPSQPPDRYSWSHRMRKVLPCQCPPWLRPQEPRLYVQCLPWPGLLH